MVKSTHFDKDLEGNYFKKKKLELNFVFSRKTPRQALIAKVFDEN